MAAGSAEVQGREPARTGTQLAGILTVPILESLLELYE